MVSPLQKHLFFNLRALINASHTLTRSLFTDFWYAIRARWYVQAIGKEADLKISVVTHYDTQTGSTFVLLKYRSYNDLPQLLFKKLKSKLIAFVKDEGSTGTALNPIALCLFHFGLVIQEYRRGARDPRDTIRNQEDNVHKKRKTTQQDGIVDLKTLHRTLGSLDQNIVQLDFILDLITRLRRLNRNLHPIMKGMGTEAERHRLNDRVEHRLERYECHVTYIRNGQREVASKAERLIHLVRHLPSSLPSPARSGRKTTLSPVAGTRTRLAAADGAQHADCNRVNGGCHIDGSHCLHHHDLPAGDFCGDGARHEPRQWAVEAEQCRRRRRPEPALVEPMVDSPGCGGGLGTRHLCYMARVQDSTYAGQTAQNSG